MTSLRHNPAYVSAFHFFEKQGAVACATAPFNRMEVLPERKRGMTEIDIISGFLGAGKTTLIKKLLNEALQQEQVVLIENEFGEIGIDGGFMKESGIEVKEMNSGCICCSLSGDFGRALNEVMEVYHPDRILLEPSGVGKLSDVLKAVADAKPGGEVSVHSAVAVVDAGKAGMYIKNFGEFFINQISYAGCIILSKTSSMSSEKLMRTLELLREYNEQAVIVTTDWKQLSGKMMLDAMEGGNDFMEGIMEAFSDGESEHHHGEEGESCCHARHHHHADEIFQSWGAESPREYTKDEVNRALLALRDEKNCGLVLRAKGMVPQKDCGRWIYFDYVPGKPELREGQADVTGKLCVIGSQLQKEQLNRLFLLNE